MQNRILVSETSAKIGEKITVAGWVHARRDHGGLIFIDLRDRTGLLQIVFTGELASHDAAALRAEWVVLVEGTIKKRPENMVNPDIPTGTIELKAETLDIISEAATPPFPLDNDGYDINEELRMEFRYLDLRRERMARNIRLRHKVTTLAREYLNSQDFVEIETPLLTKTSPEGARDYLVPSRNQPGKFYALPQAPQQYKQLLMIAGFERYYQIARALRDEDPRGDRQPEHTQIDLEMSFVRERDVLDVVEGMMIHITQGVGKKILEKPFPVLSHKEAMEKYGDDKFDLRPEPKDSDTLAFAWVVDFPLLEKDQKTGGYTFVHNPFSAPHEEDLEKLLGQKELETVRARQYDLVCNGFEVASGGVRISDPQVQRKVFEIMGLSTDEAEDRFGHLLRAYEFGAPPHAGIAPGLDRLVMILANEPNIREVIAFPKTGDGRDPMMQAPSEASAEQLRELGIEIKKKKDV